MSEFVNKRAPPKVDGGHIRKGWQKRMAVSDSLKTTDMWKIIGHDPYENPDHDNKLEEKKRRNKPGEIDCADHRQHRPQRRRCRRRSITDK